MRRNGIQVMGKLIGLVKPLAGFMVLAIILGVLGNLAAILIPVLGSTALLNAGGYVNGLALGTILTILILCGVFRGVLRYGEQSCNHYIAFKLLAIIRHKVFVKLRTLAPAKLEGKEKGNLISVITNDIELLEVFYAHTISPIAIALITSLIITAVLISFSPLLGIISLIAYISVGVIIPLLSSGSGGETGYAYRQGLGRLNSYYLDSLRGIREVLQFGLGQERLEEISHQTGALEEKNKVLKGKEGSNRAITDAAILLFSTIMLIFAYVLYSKGKIDFAQMVTAFTLMISSFGPVVALSNLSNNLFHTIASGNRVLDLLEEEPIMEEIEGKEKSKYGDIRAEHVTFSYEEEVILKDVSLHVKKGTVFGIHGKSGSGKSTLLKLIMRFWEVDKGQISIHEKNVNKINTKDLRNMESFVTQDTCLFHDTITENIRIGKEDATQEEIEAAAKKASIHEFILSLPDGYKTNVGELGDRMSGGEKQRIGLARAFLHNGPLMLLDEPTSNLDSQNEAVILKSLKEGQEDKTIILVSHRKSTLNIADETIALEDGRAS